MSTMNSILNKLANAEKIELAKQHVDLALIDDLDNLYKTYSTIAIDAIKIKSKIQSEIKSLLSNLEKAKTAEIEASKKASTIEAAAKNIGIDVPDLVVKIKNSKNFNIDKLISWSNNSINE